MYLLVRVYSGACEIYIYMYMFSYVCMWLFVGWLCCVQLGSLSLLTSLSVLSHLVISWRRFRRAREALRACLPEPFRDGKLVRALGKDNVTKQWLLRLLMQVGLTPEY
jgi:hypothetical protein